MWRYRFNNLKLVLTCLLASSASDPVFSQSEKKHQNKLLEEVVVTAQKREESVNDVPIAVSALSGEAMEAMGITDTRDLNVAVPGFSASDGGYGSPVYTLRGVGFNDATYFATPTTGVYFDQAALPYSIMSKGMNIDIKQVEVLKGPQGTLFGRSTTGGAINYIFNKPTESFEAGVSVSLGNYNTTDIEVFASGPISDNFGYRLVLRDYQQSDPWQYSATDRDKELGEKDKQAFRGIFDFTPTDNILARFTLAAWRDNSDSQAGQPIAAIPQNAFAGRVPGADTAFVDSDVANYPYIPDSDDPREAEWCTGDEYCIDEEGNPLDFVVDEIFYHGSVFLQWYLSESTELVVLSSYNYYESDGSRFPVGGLPYGHNEVGFDVELENIDFEARLSGLSEDQDIRWLIGINTTPKDKGYESRDTSTGPSNSVIFPLLSTDITLISEYYNAFGYTDYKSIAPFANLEWQINDSFKATIGGRYTEEERTYTGCMRSTEDNRIYLVLQTVALQRALLSGTTPGIAEPGGCFSVSDDGNFDQYAGELKEDSLSYRGVLDWTPNENSMYYFSYTRGFKSGSFPVTNASNQSQVAPVVQEQVDAYEIGAKLDFYENLHVNLAAYHYDYKDKQLYSRIEDFIFGALPSLANAPEAEVDGFEIDFTYSPIDGLFLAGSAAYVDTNVVSFPDAFDTRGNQTDLSGSDFNFSPKLTYNLLADYSIPIFENYVAGIGIDYAFKDETNSTLDADPVFAHDSFGLWNARLRLGAENSSWEVTLWGKIS